MKWPLTYSVWFTALAAGLLVSCGKHSNDKPRRRAEDAIPITVARVATAPLDRSIPVTGTLSPKDEATLGAEVEGRVEKTLVEFGSRVEEGQLLAQIDTTT
jgi:multidrug efflux pump subunit AcrA (membrane-fusion protein)